MPSKAKENITSTDHTPSGVHSLVAMPATPAPDPTAQPNAMATPDGDLFYPDGPEDALLFHVEHGATPVNLDRWPWPGVAGSPAAVDPAEFCATPDACFPNGVHPAWTGVACVHTGGQTHWLDRL
jgi:hypothetical protein